VEFCRSNLNKIVDSEAQLRNSDNRNGAFVFLNAVSKPSPKIIARPVTDLPAIAVCRACGEQFKLSIPEKSTVDEAIALANQQSTFREWTI